MAINWGQQQPIQPPRVLGSLAPSPSGAQQAGELGQGILSGIAQGQGIQSNQLLLDKQRMEANDTKELRAAAAENLDKYGEVLKKQDPIKYQQYEYNKQLHQNALTVGKSNIVDLTIKERALAQDNLALSGTVVQETLAQQDPQKAAETWKKGAEHLNKNIPGMKLDTEYSPDNVAGLAFATKSVQNSLQKEPQAEVQKLSQMQNQVRALENEITQRKSKGLPTSKEEKELGQWNNRIDTLVKNKQTTAKDTYTEKFQEDLGALDAKAVAEGTTSLKAGKMLDVQLDGTLKKLEEVPESQMGLMANVTGLNTMMPEFQEFDQGVQDIALSVKDTRYKLGGGQGFSDKDAERLTSIAKGGIYAYKGTAKNAILYLKKLNKVNQAFEYMNVYNKRKGNPGFEQWKESTPIPYVPMKVGEQLVEVPADQVDAIIREQKAKYYLGD